MYKPEHFPSLQHVPLPQLLLFLHADRNSLSLELTSLISMALAKERVAQDTNMGTIQSFANIFGVPPLIQVSDPPCESYGFESYRKMLLEEGETSEKGCHLPSLSGLVQDANCSDFMFTASNSSSSEEAHSLVNFETRSDQWAYTNGSQLSFEQGARASHPASYSEDEYLGWIDAMDNRNECDYLNSKCAVGPSLLEDLNSYEATSGSVSMKSAKKDIQYGWLYPSGDSLQDSGLSQGCSNKRPHIGGDVQTGKKHCARETRKPRTKQVPSKDPQSIAAKRRRERISEKLKILQDLVPNGSKVDLVTMLEKAISYVKFLQLQVKVLATDEFWPVQGGKAPEVAQVKKAIDAILSSHRRS